MYAKWPKSSTAPHARCSRHWRRAWPFICSSLLLWAARYALATDPSAAELLRGADAIKLGDHVEFTRLFKLLESKASELSSADREYLDYLRGWSSAYDGDYGTAIKRLEALQDAAKDATIRFRSGITVVNVLSLSGNYEEAYSRLNGLLGLLPQVSSGEARQQGMLIATFLYNEVGQYDLSLRYAQSIIDENWAGKGVCRGGQLKLEALYKSGKLREVGPELQGVLNACSSEGETTFKNAVPVDAARVYLERHKYDEAIALLKAHYDDAIKGGYRRLVSEYDALLAQAYRRKSPAMARQVALHGVENALKGQYTQALATVYGVLYELAKEQGDFKAALAFHEQYAIADKGYLDEASARHLAFEKVSHQDIANRLQIESLNERNRILQLQQELSAKAVETSRLYITVLASVVLFVGLWAYRTKRSQLHFRSLAQIDALTGIWNRPYFVEQAERTLEHCRKTDQHVSIILCDLDQFKAINDRCGHATGDLVLERTAAGCKSCLRKGDLFGRVGGEEFAIVLPGCDIEQARELAERLRTAIAAITVVRDTHKASVSASFGVTATRKSGYQLQQLLANADDALYRAKRGGRNRVMVHGVPDEVLMAGAVNDDPLPPPDRLSAAN